MKLGTAAVGLTFCLSALAGAAEEPTLLAKVTPLPVALNKDFEFRKTKLYLLTEKAPKQGTQRKATSLSPGALSSTAPQRTIVNQDSSIAFERQYRLFGAVTHFDQHQRFGNYFDFFWRAKRPADLTVRLEYRQEKPHEFVQAQELSYADADGKHQTEFKVVGDDYFDDGRGTEWRCHLTRNGRTGG